MAAALWPACLPTRGPHSVVAQGSGCDCMPQDCGPGCIVRGCDCGFDLVGNAPADCSLEARSTRPQRVHLAFQCPQGLASAHHAIGPARRVMSRQELSNGALGHLLTPPGIHKELLPAPAQVVPQAPPPSPWRLLSLPRGCAFESPRHHPGLYHHVHLDRALRSSPVLHSALLHVASHSCMTSWFRAGRYRSSTTPHLLESPPALTSRHCGMG